MISSISFETVYNVKNVITYINIFMVIKEYMAYIIINTSYLIIFENML